MKDSSRDIHHPLFSTSITNWIRLLVDNGGVDIGFFLRAVFITVFTIILSPARLISKVLYNSRVAKTRIENPPIFIIGHWRSGTTFLHEVISQDPQLAYISLWHTLVPDSFLFLENLKTLMARFLPATRPMDMIKVDVDSPYEEEAGLAVLGPWSFFHCFIFPRNPERRFRQSVLFEDMSDKDMEIWKRNYLQFLKAVTFANNGKQLILKNPADTSRIRVLLELFPDARFIHIYRNPYKVYMSTKKLRMQVLGLFALQKTTEQEIEKHVLKNYVQLMESYFEQKDLIPKGRLVEIRYEEFVANPLEQIRQIYSKLGLTGFEEAKPAMQKHLHREAGYKKNVYTFDKNIKELVDKHWGFTIKKWGYKPPQ